MSCTQSNNAIGMQLKFILRDRSSWALLALLIATVNADVFLSTRTIKTATAPNVIAAMTALAYDNAGVDLTSEENSNYEERMHDKHIIEGMDQCLFIIAMSDITPFSRRLLDVSGAYVLESVPENAYIVLAKRSVVSALLLSGPSVSWAGKFLSSDKFGEGLLVLLSKEAAGASPGMKLKSVIVTLAVSDKSSESDVATMLEKLMSYLSDLARRDKIMSFENLSLYSKQEHQCLISLRSTSSTQERVDSLHWLSQFCEVVKISSALPSDSNIRRPEPLQLNQFPSKFRRRN